MCITHLVFFVYFEVIGHGYSILNNCIVKIDFSQYGWKWAFPFTVNRGNRRNQLPEINLNGKHSK